MKSFAAIAIVAAASLATVPGKREDKVRLESGGLRISQRGYQLILDYEVGGGKPYYVRFLQRPEWPGGASGVTIGVGYDLGYNTREQIAADWAGLDPGVIARLQGCAGIKGTAAQLKCRSVRDLVVPWEKAIAVYEARTVPRFATATRKAYPGTETLNPDVQGAMLSWVFNRGEGITGSSRDLEKRQMRDDIPRWPQNLPKRIRASKRLWTGKGLDGLLERRDAEAALIESSLSSPK